MEEKINLLYNFLYNDSYNNCFNIGKITLGKITIDDIKIDNEDEVKNILKDIIETKIVFNNHDENLQIIYLKSFSDNFPVNIKIGPYFTEIDNLENESNNDSLLLSQ